MCLLPAPRCPNVSATFSGSLSILLMRGGKGGRVLCAWVSSISAEFYRGDPYALSATEVLITAVPAPACAARLRYETIIQMVNFICNATTAHSCFPMPSPWRRSLFIGFRVSRARGGNNNARRGLLVVGRFDKVSRTKKISEIVQTHLPGMSLHDCVMNRHSLTLRVDL